ncbi:hypothetical protein EGT36_29230 [Agrobacterium sp. FDAARGOS_525]|nr:hypothetical protein EGT36_29230 [Agrobacterium sp. FDAARGOS_525]
MGADSLVSAPIRSPLGLEPMSAWCTGDVTPPLSIWFRCLRRRSQKSRRMSWTEFEPLTARFELPVPRIARTWEKARR